MLIFGHTGITLAAAVLLEGALAKRHALPTRTDELTGQPQPSAKESLPQNYSRGAVSWITSLANRIDIRILLIGSLLPDIVDKAVGYFFFRDTFSNGQIFCHTLLFLIVITLGGLYLYWSRHRTWLLTLSFGTFTHLILDGMWLTPQTLLWPLYGFSFEKLGFIDWMLILVYIFEGLMSYNPEYVGVAVVEFVGVVIVVWFVWFLVRRRRLYTFIRNGRV